MLQEAEVENIVEDQTREKFRARVPGHLSEKRFVIASDKAMKTNQKKNES